MDRKLSDIINGLMLLVVCGLFIFDGLLAWIMFQPQIQNGIRFVQAMIF